MPTGQTLYVQVDGAADNVNQTTLRFLSWLCQTGVCKTVRGAGHGWRGNGEFVVYSACLRLCALLCLRQVVLTRLPVGHTHDDVDQKFSVAARVRKHANNSVPRVLLGA